MDSFNVTIDGEKIYAEVRRNGLHIYKLNKNNNKIVPSLNEITKLYKILHFQNFLQENMTDKPNKQKPNKETV